MGLALITPPTYDPISLAEAKAHCRITSDDEDGLLAGYILAARQYVENECYLRLITQTIDYTIDGDWPCLPARGYWRHRIEFPIGPVQSVTSVSYVGSDGSTQTLATDQYVSRNMGTAVQSGRPFIEPAYNVTWPNVRCETASITVRIVAGWDLSNVPNPLMQAMRMLIAHANENREAVGTGGAVLFTQVPLGVESFISPYRLARVA